MEKQVYGTVHPNLYSYEFNNLTALLLIKYIMKSCKKEKEI